MRCSAGKPQHVHVFAAKVAGRQTRHDPARRIADGHSLETRTLAFTQSHKLTIMVSDRVVHTFQGLQVYRYRISERPGRAWSFAYFRLAVTIYGMMFESTENSSAMFEKKQTIPMLRFFAPLFEQSKLLSGRGRTAKRDARRYRPTKIQAFL